MTKEDILNYVMDTPENTNRMVLNDMIDELVNSSGSNTSLITVIVEDEGPNASISAAEVYEGLQNGLRYEVIYNYYGTIIPFGEITLCRSATSTYFGDIVASVSKITTGVIGSEESVDIDFINIVNKDGVSSWNVYTTWARIPLDYHD